MLVFGFRGVLAGVKDSSGDDVGFRFLSIDNEQLGHLLQLFTGHEVVVDGAYLSGADGAVPGLANVSPDLYVQQWKAFKEGGGTVSANFKRMESSPDALLPLPGETGFAACCALDCAEPDGIFDSPQMPEPILLGCEEPRSDCEGSEGRGNALRTFESPTERSKLQLPPSRNRIQHPSAEQVEKLGSGIRS